VRPQDRTLLDALLRLETTNAADRRTEHDKCRTLVIDAAAQRGLRALVLESGFSPVLIGTRPEERRPRVLLAAHLDVVAGSAEQFQPRTEGKNLIARGASDMKFAVPLFFRVLDELPAELRDHVLIALTFDEETGGTEGTRFLLEKHGLRPGCCFLPDGGDNFQIEAAEKGVFQFRLRTKGKSAHGSRPWLGVNAIDAFFEIYQDLRRKLPTVGPETWGPTLNLGKLAGGAAANQVPDAAEALLDTRFTEASTLDEVRALVQSVVAGRAEVEPVVAGDVFHLDMQSRTGQLIQQAAREVLGRELPIYRSEGASDARFFTRHEVPVVITKPTCGGHHSANEWIDLPSLEPYYRMMLHFVQAAAADEKLAVAPRRQKRAQSPLPSVDQTLEDLRALEKRYSEGERVAQTQAALAANERFSLDRARVDRYLGHLGSKDMFLEMYGLGHAPSGLPVALPQYLMEIMDASSRVLCALTRQRLEAEGPQLLLGRVRKGWLTEEMAEKLHDYFLDHEPDMGFDVLVYGRHSQRGMTFEELKRSGDWLHAKILEAQSVDTYYGWVREYIRGSRAAGLDAEHHRFTWCTDATGRVLTDDELETQVAATLNHGLEHEPDSIMFLEIDPEKQATYQNLCFMCESMCRGRPEKTPLILDPRSTALRGGRLYCTLPGKERELKKVISRIVDFDLGVFLQAREADGNTAAIEHLRQIFATGHLFRDLSKHLCGFYLVDKSSLTEMSLLGEVSTAPRTELITPAHMERYRKDPLLLRRVAIKPLHGMSAKGVVVSPTLAQVEEAVAEQPILTQETLWASPVLPNILPDLQDPDVQAGICSEARLVMQAGSPAVPHEPHRARVIAGLSRSHFQSRDPERKVKDDPKNRGWYSNISAIMAVRQELGITRRDDGGVGMSPIYSLR
jgi:succinyl-diaminopimelate desuccinylase